MGEVRRELRVYNEEYVCDRCGRGQMRSTGVVYESSPPRYQHFCETCGHLGLLDACYPRTVHEPAGGPEGAPR